MQSSDGDLSIYHGYKTWLHISRKRTNLKLDERGSVQTSFILVKAFEMHKNDLPFVLFSRPNADLTLSLRTIATISKQL